MELDPDRAVIAGFTACRADSQMTQVDLAKRVTAAPYGVLWTRMHVAAMESGRRRSLRLAEILSLCSVYGVTLAEMLARGEAPDTYIEQLLVVNAQGETPEPLQTAV